MCVLVLRTLKPALENTIEAMYAHYSPSLEASIEPMLYVQLQMLLRTVRSSLCNAL